MILRNAIDPEEFERLLNTRLSPTMRERWAGENLEYQELTSAERDRYLLDFIETLMKPDLRAAGEHRRPDWETGWSENLDALRSGGTPNRLIPKYHGKLPLARWGGRMIRAVEPGLDYRIHCLLVDWAIDTYLKDVTAIYEFGCGPAYHLLRARQLNSRALLVGLDWTKASQQIIAEIVQRGIETNIEGHNFDFYHPDPALKMVPGAGVMTVAALEQVGDKFESFLEFLLSNRPTICVHLEPIDELIPEDDLLGRMSVLYCRKRNYLNGFLPHLQQLEQQKRIKIHAAQRTYCGSYFIEGHSLIVWSPL